MIDLQQGDCLELMKDIPDGSVDLTVTSPPYDNLRTYNGNIDQWNFEKFQGVARELYRVTKQGGVVVWVIGDATVMGFDLVSCEIDADYCRDNEARYQAHIAQNELIPVQEIQQLTFGDK